MSDSYPIYANHGAGIHLAAKLADFGQGLMLGFIFHQHEAYGFRICNICIYTRIVHILLRWDWYCNLYSIDVVRMFLYYIEMDES